MYFKPEILVKLVNVYHAIFSLPTLKFVGDSVSLCVMSFGVSFSCYRQLQSGHLLSLLEDDECNGFIAPLIWAIALLASCYYLKDCCCTSDVHAPQW